MITYENYGDYYIFSHKPNTRIYLGDNSPDDYVEDEINQQKRSASAWYKEVHTGKDITWDEIMDNDIQDQSRQGNGLLWYGDSAHEFDKRENYTFEGGHSFNFERKVKGLASFGNGERSASYVQAYKSEAWAYVSGTTLEHQKAVEAKIRKEFEERDRKSPWIANLVMIWTPGIGNETYYVDDDNNRITVDEHVALMKAKFGDDVFEKADEELRRENPEAIKMAEEIIRMQTETKDMTSDEKIEYLKNYSPPKEDKDA